jgi:hypothetical protein
MATSLAEIERCLTEEDLRFTRVEEYVRTSFSTDYYQDSDGDRSIFLVLKPEEDGEYFKLIAPNLYNLPANLDAGTREAVFKVLLMVCWRTKLIQFEYDDSDGEVRAIVEFPLEDAPLTHRQLMRCIHGMVQIVDEYHPIIANVIATGKIDFSGPKLGADLGKLAMEYYAFMGRKKRAGAGKLRLEE